MRPSRKLLVLCLPLLAIADQHILSASGGATAQAQRFDYAAYRLSTWNRNREAIGDIGKLQR